ncbi:hypothetical protein GALMADRAFT_147553 [Galerina marginata CBS 339.88]|uniref:F-box domain-containing protein n=1 Tax=Galerina marginata (strain CBS 339.88) TaxID=685588 RepID=A0A067S7U5_GALM3|nr:hypothetical protein GALMADRAFT_147553 [Galerina marginata CBS 339.88]
MASINASYPLPPDIFFVIIDMLATDLRTPPLSKLQALIALSATCQLLLELARKHIFRTVSIRTSVPRPSWMTPDDFPSISFDAMESVLKRNPSVANSVRRLKCQLFSLDFKNSGIGRVLRKFSHLRSLTLMAHEHVMFSSMDDDSEDYSDGSREDGFDGYETDSDQDDVEYGIDDQFIDWRYMSQDLLDTLRTLAHLPTLSTIELAQIVNFPLEFLAACQHLQTLSMFKCRISQMPQVVPFDSEPHLPSRKAIRLQELRIIPGARSNVRGLKETVLGGIPILDISHIRELSFTFTTDFDAPQLGELLAGLLHLETLTLAFKGGSYELPDNFGAMMKARARYCMDNLRNLRIQHDILENSYLLEFLLDIPSFSKLHDVEIYLKVYPDMTDYLSKDMEHLAKEFSIESKFPVLETVSVSICLDEDGESSDSSEEDEDKEDRAEAKAETRSVWKNLRTTELAPLSALGTVRLSYSVEDVAGNIIA